jgi:hypothetical protein
LSIQWLFVGAAFLFAVGALLRARRVAKRLEWLTESYWELRYEYGQLRARVARLEPPAESVEPDPQAPARPPANFVPLSSLKR